MKNYALNNTGANHYTKETEQFSAKEFRLVLDSSLKSLSKIEKFLFLLKASFYIDESKYASMLFSITEAVTNAIVCGNKSNPEKKVYILVRHNSKVVSFTIEDEGNGFDFTNIQDPTEIKEQNEKCGRGIFIMQKLSDSLHYSEKGKRLNILFSLNT